MPKFLDYLHTVKFPQFPLWSKILLQDMFLSVATKTGDTVSMHGNNIFIKNQTNATVENVFKQQKTDKSKLKQPIMLYIENNQKQVKSLQRQYIEEILKSTEVEKRRANIYKTDCKLFASITGEIHTDA